MFGLLVGVTRAVGTLLQLERFDGRPHQYQSRGVAGTRIEDMLCTFIPTVLLGVPPFLKRTS